MNAMDDSHDKRRTGLICLGLALAVLAAYSPLWHCRFVLYDDNEYVLANPMVRHGLTWQGIQWAFTTAYASNWHPLTWISHMIDCQVYGMNPADIISPACFCTRPIPSFSSCFCNG